MSSGHCASSWVLCCPWSDSRGIGVPQWVTALILTFGLLPAAEELLSSGEQGVSTAAQSLFPALARLRLLK